MIGSCVRDIDPSFHTSLVSLLMYDHYNGGHILEHGDVMELQSGPRIAAARNIVVDGFLDHPKKPEWLLMLDTDMVFPPNVLNDMLEVANPITTPILGGLCFIGGRGAKVEPTIKICISKDPLEFETVWNYPLDSLVSCDATGAACLLVHRSVYEAVGTKFEDTGFPYYAEGSSQEGANIGEDVMFCMRARSLGFPIHVHTGIQFGHMKRGAYLDHEAYMQYRRGITADENGEEGYTEKYLARRFIQGAKAV